ncbi:MAG: succinate dehydrogenase, hydrophobic membrane anchor protein [Rickettsiales bacterium]|nr:succinate dehydrogenase, hydrophobic membrane anchor protein [Rickettsiales bacterium]|tara:strand:+ start:4784 stop:5116 length:333 start_codon:yes stop_codon:yes gene_type:complete
MKKNYSYNWILQKVYALIFLFLLIYTFISLTKIDIQNYSEVLGWFRNYINSLIFFVLYTTIILHSNIGLSSIIDDYIHTGKNKKIILILKNLFLITIFSISVVSLLLINR